VRELSNEEANRLLRLVRRSSGSVVGGDVAAGPMVLLSAQGMDVGQIARVAFTSEDRVRAVVHNFNDDGFDSLYPKYTGGRPPSSHSLNVRRSTRSPWAAQPITGCRSRRGVWPTGRLPRR
jgi:hypothetical protein